MTFTATWDASQSRVVLTAGAVPAGITTVRIERFVTPTLTNAATVRGSTLDGADPGTGFTISDREFKPGVLNTYRLLSFTAGVLTSTQTATITPTQTVAYLRSVARPFLDRPITIIGWDDVASPARGGVLEIVGRRHPVAITETRGSRRFTLQLRAADREEADALELFFSFGDVVFLQVPAGCVVPGSLYAYVGDTALTRVGKVKGEVRYVSAPLVEVAAPDDTVVGYTATYAGIEAGFATYAALKAAFATYQLLSEYVSAPADEITG